MKATITHALFAALLTVAHSSHAAEPLSNTVNVKGAIIETLSAGNGPLMILLHGALGDHNGWRQHVELLSKDFHVVAIPLRHYAKGAWGEMQPANSYMDQAANDIAEVVSALGRGPAHLVGWSMGGQVAHMTALKYPEAVRSAYLFEGILSRDASETDRLFAPLFLYAKQGDKSGLLKFTVEKIAFGTPYESMPEKAKQTFNQFAGSFIKVLNSPQPELVTCNASRQAAVPMVLVRGDATTPTLKSLLFSDDINSCFDIETVKGADHIWPRKETNDFVASVTRFAKQH